MLDEVDQLIDRALPSPYSPPLSRKGGGGLGLLCKSCGIDSRERRLCIVPRMSQPTTADMSQPTDQLTINGWSPSVSLFFFPFRPSPINGDRDDCSGKPGPAPGTGGKLHARHIKSIAIG